MNYSTGKYDDIINLPRHESKKHPKMSLDARSAQFAPFAALTGHDEAIKETARLTSQRKEITEEQKLVLNEKLKMIQDKINTIPKITVMYFIQDEKKSGGEYVTVTGNVKKIDKDNRLIILVDGVKILIDEIIDIV